MTNASTKTTPPPELEPPAASTRPSTAIQHGADLLLNLVGEERVKLTRLYHDGLKALEARFIDYKAKHGAALATAETKVAMQQKLIKDLSQQSQTQNLQSPQDGSSEELQTLRSENERLKASLAGVGLEYVDGSLRFDEPTTRVVENFVQGARLQETQLSILLGVEAQVKLLPDERLSKSVGPTEFFGVLAGVLEKGRSFATDLEKAKMAGEDGKLERKDVSTQDIANAIMTRTTSEPKTQELEIREVPLSPTDHDRNHPGSPTSKRPSPFPTPSSPPAKIQKTT